MEGFQSERFTDPDKRQEVSLSENKVQIYRLRYSERDVKKWQNGELNESPAEPLAEFIRDMIALANAVRQRGKPGYLLFGIQDKTYEIVGIEGQCTKPGISLATRSQEEINRYNAEDFEYMLQKYVGPAQPLIDYRVGLISGKLVSYLEVIPQPIPESYQVKTNLDEVKAPLRIGNCWIRRGESKGVLLSETEKQYLYAWSTVPYVSVTQWKTYLARLEGDKDFDFIEDITGYQELNSEAKSLSQEVQDFTSSSLSLLIIEGYAGCGKSVFLQNQARQAARMLVEELEIATEYVSFQNPIPIFICLNSFSIKPGEPLERQILEYIVGQSLLDVDESAEPEKLLKDRGKRWLIFLDAFDELVPELQRDLWNQIYRLAISYQTVQVILTSRPDYLSANLQGVKIVKIQPLSDPQIRAYLTASVPLEQLESTLQFLHSDNELWKHLRLPLFLKTAASYFSGGRVLEDREDLDPFWEEPSTPTSLEVSEAVSDSGVSEQVRLKQILKLAAEELIDEEEMPLPPPTLQRREEEVETPMKMSVFLHRVFRRLWKHNEEKQISARLQGIDPDDLYVRVGEMAAKTGETNSQELMKKEAEQYLKEGLKWVLDLGILFLPKRKPNRVKFPTMLSKIYFAAYYLSLLLDSDSKEWPDIITVPTKFWDRCVLFIEGLAETDTSQVTEHLRVLKGEQNHG